MADANSALAAKEANKEELLEMEGVEGVGIGFVDPDDEEKGMAVVLFVRKGASEALAGKLPKALSGGGKSDAVPVRIEESGGFYAHVALENEPWAFEMLAGHPEYSRRIRPARPGYSIGTPGGSGTTGLIVAGTGSSDKGQPYVASNNHVLNSGNDRSYDETIQAGGADGGISGRDKIGAAASYVALKSSGDNYMDAATALPDAGYLVSTRYPTIGDLPGHYETYRVGWTFYKVGRTTGAVRGRVDAVRAEVKIAYGSYGGLGTITFKDQTVILSSEAVSLPGDSGSVWLRDSDNYACAMNYAGGADGRRSIAFPFNWFADVFGVAVGVGSLRDGLRAGEKIAVVGDEDESLYASILSKEELAGIMVEKFDQG